MSNATMYSNSENMIDFQFIDSEGDTVSMIFRKDDPLFQINCKKQGSSVYDFKWNNQVNNVMQVKAENEEDHRIAFTWKKISSDSVNSGLYVRIDDKPEYLGPIVTLY